MEVRTSDSSSVNFAIEEVYPFPGHSPNGPDCLDPLSSPDLSSLLEWSASHGAVLHDAVSVFDDASTGLSLRASRNIKPGKKLVTCPLEMTLSYLNVFSLPNFPARSSPSFPKTFIEKLKKDDPNVIGKFFLIQQLLAGENSFWWPYIRNLPQPADICDLPFPTVWAPDERAFLKDTNLWQAIHQRLFNWGQEWEKGVGFLKNEYEGWEGFTFLRYKWASTIFDSRSFRPSLTIPPGMFFDLSAYNPDATLHTENIRKDKFAVLLPLVDIGNHDGSNQLNWTIDEAGAKFVLDNKCAIARGNQIYNYYGDKSNSELLLAYGFMLDQSNDKINVRLKATPDHMRTWRVFHPDVSTPDNRERDSELLFSIANRGILTGWSDNESAVRHSLKFFSEGLLDLLSCLVANSRERWLIAKASDVLPESNLDPFDGIFTRNFVYVMAILNAKLRDEIVRLEKSADLPWPATTLNQRVAREYVLRQLAVCKNMHNLFEAHLGLPIKYSSLYPMQLPNSPRAMVPPDILGHFELVSVEEAFAWLRSEYVDVHHDVMELIAEQQDEPLPIDWAPLMEDWDYTYLVVWVCVLWLLVARDDRMFMNRHPDLAWWMLSVQRTRAISDKDLNDNFIGEASEKQAIRWILTRLPYRPSMRGIRDDTLIRRDARTKLISFASYFVSEEILSLRLAYPMRDGAQRGTPVPQRLLGFTQNLGGSRQETPSLNGHGELYNWRWGTAAAKPKIGRGGSVWLDMGVGS